MPAPPEGQQLNKCIMTDKEKQEIVQAISDEVVLTQKTVLTSTEAAKYLGLSLSKLYKLTCAKEIPHYKPNGKFNYFERAEIEAWALRNRIATNDEINDKARVLARRQK